MSDDVSAEVVRRRPTLEERLRRGLERGAAAGDGIPRRPAGEPAPLSFAQRRLWFLEQLVPGTSAFHIGRGVELAGPLSPPALARAFAAAVRRHPALTAAFDDAGGEPVQRLGAAPPPPLARLDLAALPEPAARRELVRLERAESRRAFRLDRPPLVRAFLARLPAAGDDERHALWITLHHAVADGASLAVLLRDVSSFYRAEAGGADGGLAGAVPGPPAADYGDWAAWQRRRLSGPALDRRVEWWRRELAGMPPVLEVPADRARSARPALRGRRHVRALPRHLAEALHRLAAGCGATPFMVGLAAFAALLARRGGERRLVVGTPVAGRDARQIEEVVGFFANTLPLPLEVGGKPSFAELVARVRQVTVAALDHADAPFDAVVEALAPERSLSHTPLFQVVFAFESLPAVLDLPGVTATPRLLDRPPAQFDLDLTLVPEAGGGLAAHLVAAADRFLPATAERFLAAFETLLAAALTAPGTPVERLPALAPAEAELLFAAWNPGPQDLPGPPLLHDLVAAQAAASPDAPAVSFAGESLTYAELVRRADGVSAALARLGVGPEARVGVAIERSIELLVGLLGVLGAGAAYVPLDPGYPEERLAFTAADALGGQEAAVLLTQPALAERFRALAPAGTRLLVLPPGGELPAAAGADAPPPRRTATLPDNPAYVLYTSGSTGRPKGVVVSHRAIVNHTRWMLGALPWASDDRVLQKTPASFDASLCELFTPLAAGATVVMAPPGVHRDPVALMATVAGERITVVQAVPSLLAELAQVDAPAAWASLRWLLSGGEALTGELVEALRRRGHFPIFNLYGPTEAAVDSTWAEVAAGTPAPTVPIGRPIANARAYVVGRDGLPLAPGAAGELLVGGAGLARGYLARPALTAERFVPDAFGSEAGARLYRTGDLVRWLPNGEIDFLGRLDHQVKVRGFRIELGEIEAVLAAAPGVAGCAVEARGAGDGVRVVAWVVPAGAAGEAGAAGVDAAGLAAWLGQRLPAFMVPSRFVVLDALPLSPNGKLDRRALVEPALDETAAATAPRTPVEGEIAAVWAEVLGRPVGVHDDFFAAGGHSLLATRVVSRLRHVLAIELPLADLFEAPTVARLASRVETALAAGRPAAPPIERADRRGPLPLSFAQERLWFLDRWEPASALYNVPFALDLDGPVDNARLAAALAAVVARHEALRTRFVEVDGAPAQVVDPPPVGFPLPEVDLRAAGGAPADDPAAAAGAVGASAVGAGAGRSIAVAEARRPFDLAAGSLLRAVLLTLGEERHRLVVVVHHLVFDGWSLALLLAELGEIYRALGDGRPTALARLPVQVADFAAWQRRELAGERLDSLLGDLRRRLAGVPELSLPTDRPRPAERRGRGTVLRRTLPADAAAAIGALARGTGVTPFMVLTAAFQAIAARWSGQADFAVGSPVAGRGRSEVEGLIGFFVNTMALRARLGDDPPFAGAVERVREEALAAFAAQEVPFERLVAELAPQRQGGRPPLVQAVVALQNTPPAALDLGPGVEAALVGGDAGTAKFDLTLFVSDRGQGDERRLDAVLEIDRDLFDPATGERFLSHLATLLAAAAAAPDTAVSRLPLIGDAERSQTIAAGLGAKPDYPRQAAIHDLVFAHAERRPQAPALLSAAGTVTYGELADRARAVARALAARGVGLETRVGLALERSPEMVVATLGVLAAGGAYVPLDPEYPPARLAFLLADAGVDLVVGDARGAAALPPGTAVLDVFVAEAEGEAAAEAEGAAAANGAPPPAVPAEALAYVMYTSGSTGTPKGVAVTHRNVVRLVAAADYAALGPQETLLQLAPTAFDAATFEVWGALASGGRLAFPPPGPVRLDEIAATLERFGVTTLWLTAGLFHQMVDEQLDALAGVRQLLAGGDVLSPPHVERVLAALPGTALINGYGPTENTTFTCCHPVRRGEAPVPIGRPIAHTTAHLVDRHGEPVPDGVPGELVTGGDGVARGYAARPALTAERFVPDPFGAPGSRLYRTGDLARRLPGGAIEFLGRRDGQVKIRGFRVETGEVEAALAALPEVERAAVAVRDTPAGERALVAWVVPAGGRGGDADEAERAAAAFDPSPLRGRLAERLPEALLPAAWVALDELPLSPNGKVDRAALPEPAWGGAGEAAGPATPLEARLAAVVGEVLGVEQVGRDDDFFALGGHSLLAVRLLARVRREWSVEVPVRRLFEEPTVAALARAVAAAAPAADAIPRRPVGEPLPASLAQERLWFLERLDPGTSAYLIPGVLRLAGDLSVGALAAALGEIVRRHQALRTTFVERDGRPWQQVVAPPERFPLPVADLAALPPARGEREAARLEAAEAARPIALEGGLLLRGLLLRLAAGEHRLAFTFHHLASDGTSVALFLAELAALYGAARRGAPSPLAEPPVQYADWAAWQRERLDGPAAAAELDWWRQRLAGAPEGLDLPADRPRRAVPRDRPGSLRRPAAAAVAEAVDALARGAGATPFMVLLAALDGLIARWTGEEDVVVGAPIAGRPRPEVEGLLGFFLNTLVLRVDASGRPSFRALLERARQAAADAFAHQEVPFERLVEALAPQRDPSRSPFFGVFLNVFPSVEEGVAFDGLAVELTSPAPRHARFDLTIYVSRDHGGRLRWHWLYDRDLFDAGRVEEMVRQLEELLVAAAADPERALGEISLRGAGSAAALPDPAAPLSAAWHGSVPQVFARRAAERPAAPAVLAPDGSLTYGELARWSGRIAWHLAGAGVTVGEPVAIWAHRSGALVPAVLGTLTAGAAFVMLDPAYPPARLAELVALARPRALVCLAAAGPVPDAVAAALAAAGCRLRLELPPLAALRDDHPLADAPEGTPEVEIGRDDLAYLAFTSGSTGRPKGIRGRHGSLTHFVPWQIEAFGFGPDDRFSLLSGLAHDPLHRDLFTPLQTGGAIVVPEPERVGEPGYLAGWMRRERVTVAHLTPAMGQVVAEPAGRLGGVPEELTAADLRWVFLVGEALTRGHVDRLAAVAPRARAVNYYGSTETQRAVGWHLCAAPGVREGAPRGRDGAWHGEGDGAVGGAGASVTGGANADAEVLPLGRGIPDVQLLVVNPAGRPAGVGELGEVWVRSPHVALGYLDDAETTAERFLANPFGSAAAADAADDRVYRTGDLGRYRPDGEVVFAGRADLQLKVRGFRVEPAEIEAALERHPAVREAVVVPRDDPAAGALLVAYVVPRPGVDSAEPRALRDHLAARLPDYMVPAAFVVLDALPRTPNGKLDRRALPAPAAGDGVAAPAAAVAPRDPVEEAVVAVFAELLPASAGVLGVDSDFFDLGGHSLLATRAVARLAAALGVEVPLRTFFDAPTPAALAARIRGLAGGETAAADGAVTRRAQGDGPPPLSFAQERLWFLERLEPGTAYNLGFAIDLDGALDRGALAAALVTVVDRHEALRTVFAERDGEPVQVVLSVQAVLPVQAVAMPPLLDLRSLPVARRDGAAAAAATALARRPFDLARGPLLATLLVALDARRHRLVVAVHHAVFDGWSTGLLLGELAAAYAAHAAGRTPELAPLPVQYGDFAVWQRRRLAGDGGAALAWWRERLAGVPVLDLPTDRPRPAMRRGRGRREGFELPAERGAAASALARRAGGTPYMVLAAAFAAVLGRWSGQGRFAVATPVAGRVRREVEPLIGLFVNTLALPFDLSGDPSFGELLARVRETSLGAFGHGELPFEKLVAELAPARSTSHPPLAQALFALQNVPETRLDWGAGLSGRPRGLDTGGAAFDVALMVRESPEDGTLAAALTVDRDLFDAATARRLAGHWQVLLAAAAEDPERRLSELPLLTEPERRQVLVEWAHGAAAGPAAADDDDAAKPAPLPARAHLAALFAAQAARTPRATALVWGEERWSYGELAARVEEIAGRLRRLGVGPEVRVGVFLDRRPELVAALLAIHAAGGAYVPLDPAYPAERVALMLDDSAAAVVVSRREMASRLAALPRQPSSPEAAVDTRRLLLVDAPAAEDGPAVPRAAAEATPENLAYVLYTSGSTGRPKGVAVEHAAVAALLAWADRLLAREELAGMLFSTSICFDLSVFEVFLPLAVGGSLILADDALALPELPAAGEVTLLNTVPSAAAELARRGALPPSVATVVCCGEPLPRDVVEEILAPGCVERLWNFYGPTEDTVYSTAMAMEAAPGQPVSIGRPIAGGSAWVVDRHGRPVPAGVPGELLLGGAGLARGYLGRAALTAERFVPDPFSGRPGARLYRTGDLVRWHAGSAGRPGGTLDFLGRLDHQVKLRGFRIELGEVEAALLACPGVGEAVAVVRHDAGDPRLAAYWSAEEEGEGAPAGDELRAALAARLPAHMVPSYFVPLAALPRTPNGKVDRKALPDPRPSAAGAAAARRAPADDVEAAVAAAFADLLGVADVGADDDFFSLGGHSLLAVRLVARLQRTLGVELPLRILFALPTPAGLAAAVRDERWAGAEIPRRPRGMPLPASFSQERLWFLERLEAGSGLLVIPAAFELAGPVDEPALAAAVAALIARHAALRTALVEEDGRLLQRVTPPPPPFLPVVDLAALPPAARRAAAGRLLAAQKRHPFDLTRPPLFRAALLRLAAEERVLSTTLHHAAGDGWSQAILWRDLSQLYAAARGGRPPALAELPVTYADFAAWQRERLSAEAGAAEIAWWRERLAGAPEELDLPADRPRRVRPRHRAGTLRTTLPAATTRALRGLAAAHGTTPFAVLVAGLAGVLGRQAGQAEVCFGMPVAGRGRAEIEDVVGLFLNTVVLRLPGAAGGGFGERVDATRRALTGALAHADVPFERLLEELQPQRDLARAPLFQVLVNGLPEGMARPELPGASVRPVADGAGAAKFDLTLYVGDDGDALRFAWVWDRDLFDGERMAETARQLEVLLAAGLADPAAPAERLPLVDGGAAGRWAAAATAPLTAAWQGPIHRLVAARAAAEPDAVAIADPGESWSYGELAARARRLAAHLAAAGVRRGDPVAVWGHRSAGLATAALGVLEAGGVLVALDPAHPPARSAQAVARVAPRAVVVVEPPAGPEDHAGEETGGGQARGAPAAVGTTSGAAGAAITARVGGDAAGGAESGAVGNRAAPQQPPEVAAALAAAGCHAIVAVPRRARSYDSLAAEPVTTILVAADSPAAAPAADDPAAAGENGLLDLGPEDPAYVAFTSGSTGAPRGIVGTHGALGRFPAAYAEVLGLGPGDRVSLLAGLAHDPLHRDLLLPLAVGATVVAPDPERLAEPGWLAGWMAAAGVTVAHLTPSTAQLLAEGAADGALPALRAAVFYGEPVRRRDAARLARLAPAARAWVSYGSTESARAVAFRPIEAAASGLAGEALPLGRGAADARLVVVARHGGLAAVGELGEVWVRGANVAAGYLDEPAATAARFRPDPWSAAPGARAVVTGDLGRFRPDGEVVFAGRADGQVKVRGFRVETGEVEAALAALPGVAEAVVRMRPGGGAAPPAAAGSVVVDTAIDGAASGSMTAAGATRGVGAVDSGAAPPEPRLIAWVVPSRALPAAGSAAAPPAAGGAAAPRAAAPSAAAGLDATASRPEAPARAGRGAAPGAAAEGSAALDAATPRLDAPGRAALDPEALRRALAGRLPDHAIPAVVVVLDALPRTANGKLDERALPDPAADDVCAAPDGEGSEDDLARLVAEVWAEVMGRARVMPDDDFFALGGHSLLATRVVSRLRQVAGVELPLRELFEAPTPRGLARRLAAVLAGDLGVTLPPVTPVARDGDLPATFSQERQWLLERLDPGNPAYHVPLALRLTGDWSPAALSAALDGVVARHESLRTVFAEVDGAPVQRVRPAAPVPMPRVDLAALPAGAARRQARRLRTVEAARPFDLAAGPLLRAVLAELPGERWLLVTLHHIATDGWSSGILVREVQALHDAFAGGRPSPLAPPAVQVGDVAVWQRRHVAGAALATQVAAWRERLAGVPPLALPTDRPRPALQRHRGVRRGLTLDRAATAELAALARAAGATPFMVLVAAWSALLARRSGQDDFAVGTFIAGRNRAETEGTIGFFVNTLALRVDLCGAPSFAELVARVRRTTLDAYGLQEAPFERVLEAVSPRRDLARSPLFQTLVVLQNLPGEPAGGERRCELLGKESDRSLVDLALWGRERDGELHLDLEVDRDLFAPATAERLLAELARLLAAVAAEPATPIDRLPPADAEEMERLLVAANATATPRAAGCVHQWVLERAAERPDAVAVETAAGRRVTYGELTAEARAVAGRLLAAGVGREDRVALAVERSPEALAAMLGTALAGAAWVPLDPAWPGERVRRVIADCAARAVVVAGDGPPAGWGLDGERAAGGSAVPTAEAAAVEGPGASLAPGMAPAVVRVGEGAPAQPAADLPAADLPPAWEGSLAYVLYTSGSTGMPKGVMVEHRSLAAYTAAAASAHAVVRGDRVLQFASLAFDASAEEIWPTLARGATLVLRDDAMLASPADFLAACGRLGITVADLPTAFWHGVAAAVAAGESLPAALRLVIIGGEQALAERVDGWREHAPGVRLLNTYGPTETTVVATSWPAGRGDGGAPIGRPVDNVRVYVVDRRLEPLPEGAPGELAIAGAGVARGYLGRPAATALRFVPDPFGAAGSRLYRSGDRARWRLDGELEFLGRLDRQLKVRGVRIEPGEIEAALARRPELAAAVVGVHEATPGDGRLVAWVVPRDGWQAGAGGAGGDIGTGGAAGGEGAAGGAAAGRAATDEDLDGGAAIAPGAGGTAAAGAPGDLAGLLRAALRRELPDSLVPTLFVTLEALPLTAAGKVDRAALPAPDLDAAASAAAWRPPETAAEELLAEIWSEVLRRERVGAGDDFFALGGHSLLATQVVARVAREIGLTMPLRQVFETPVLADLAADLEARLLAEEAGVDAAGPSPPTAGAGQAAAERDGDREVAV